MFLFGWVVKPTYFTTNLSGLVGVHAHFSHLFISASETDD
jgi:hypothetical protein